MTCNKEMRARHEQEQKQIPIKTGTNERVRWDKYEKGLGKVNSIQEGA